MAVHGRHRIDLLVVQRDHAGFLGEEVHHLAALVVEHAPEKARAALDPGDVEAAVAKALSQLVGDEAAPDDHRVLRLVAFFDECGGVVEGLEGVCQPPHLVGAWGGVGLRVPASADHQGVVRVFRAIVELNRLALDIEAGGHSRQLEVDAALGMLLDGSQQHPLPGQPLYVARQRDAVVKRVGLQPDQGH